MGASAVLFGMMIAYKVCILLVGLGLAFMGYRLFMADKVAAAGDLTGGFGKYSLSLRGGAPGLFFSLFGAVIIGASVLEGVSYNDYVGPKPNGKVDMVIPSDPSK